MPGYHPVLAVGLCLAATAFAPASADERPFELAAADLVMPEAPESVGVDATEDDAPWYETGYPWRGAPLVETDWAGLKRDTTYFLGFQVAIVGTLYLMPESVTNWDKEDLQNGDLLDQWWDHVTHPQWDSDDVVLNYIGHPYWGATYYVRGRDRGLDRGQAFVYSALLSGLYEYTLEAFAERVSIQDLIFTPLLGSLVGEYWFQPVRQRIRAKPGALSRSDKAVLFLTDPLGVVGAWTDRKLGVTTRISVQPIGPSSIGRGDPGSPRGLSPSDGFAAPTARPWGIRVDLAW